MNQMTRIALQSAYIVHRRAYRETSFLLDVLTRDFGRISLIAKGARKPKPGLAARLQPFIPLELSWQGKSDVPLLTGAESAMAEFKLSGKALFCGFYINELTHALLPLRDPHPTIFARYEQSLRALETAQSIESTLRFFELSLLEEIGYGLLLEREVERGQAIEMNKRYRYVLEHGPVEASHGPDLIHGATLLGLRQRQLRGAEQLGEAKRLMRRAIHHHLSGKPLKSRELFRYTATV
jgi:DNA repair protein RecO (recombination protein O)